MPAGTYFDCEGGGTGTWRVSNSTSSGRRNMYTGLRQSVNTYFAQLERDAGLCNTVKAAEAMGITVPFDPETGVTDQVGPFTLGVTSVSPLEMAAAYATAAGGGMYCEPQPVDAIVDMEGKVIKEYTKECKRVMTQDNAAQINDILTGLQKPGGFGYSNGTALEHPVGGQDRNHPEQQGGLVHGLHARARGRVDDRRRELQGHSHLAGRQHAPRRAGQLLAGGRFVTGRPDVEEGHGHHPELPEPGAVRPAAARPASKREEEEEND